MLLFMVQAQGEQSCSRLVKVAAVQQALVAQRQLAGYEMQERFYEIGSHEGLNELDALLRTGQLPPH